MSKRKCGCVYADRYNTAMVRRGYEMGGYLKHACPEHTGTKTMNGVITWRADGDANFYTLSEGSYWIMRVQVNGELTTPQQEKLVNDICRSLNKGE